jgi:hypothetical protein
MTSLRGERLERLQKLGVVARRENEMSFGPDALQDRRTSPTSLNLRSCLGTEHVHRAISAEM